jgi:hypothetical protein
MVSKHGSMFTFVTMVTLFIWASMVAFVTMIIMFTLADTTYGMQPPCWGGDSLLVRLG